MSRAISVGTVFDAILVTDGRPDPAERFRLVSPHVETKAVNGVINLSQDAPLGEAVQGLLTGACASYFVGGEVLEVRIQTVLGLVPAQADTNARLHLGLEERPSFGGPTR